MSTVKTFLIYHFCCLFFSIFEFEQLHLGVEQIRALELMFQPSMMGSSEAGIIETIDYVLKCFTSDEQLKLVENIYVTGGCGRFDGLKERLVRELTEIRPFQTSFNVVIADDPSLDAWTSARAFANSDNFDQFTTTKADFQEYGGEYFKEHFASNRYFPTPAALDPMTVAAQTIPQTLNETSEKIEEEIFIDDHLNI